MRLLGKVPDLTGESLVRLDTALEGPKESHEDVDDDAPPDQRQEHQ